MSFSRAVSFHRAVFRVRSFLGVKMTDKRLRWEKNRILILGKQPVATN